MTDLIEEMAIITVSLWVVKSNMADAVNKQHFDGIAMGLTDWLTYPDDNDDSDGEMRDDTGGI